MLDKGGGLLDRPSEPVLLVVYSLGAAWLCSSSPPSNVFALLRVGKSADVVRSRLIRVSAVSSHSSGFDCGCSGEDDSGVMFPRSLVARCGGLKAIPSPGKTAEVGRGRLLVLLDMSRYSGSCKLSGRPSGSPRAVGLPAGDIRGEVWRASGTSSFVSNTKKASPPSPSFMAYSCLTSLTLNST